MNVIERGRAFVEGLRSLAQPTVWDWRRCPGCGGTETCRYGTYGRWPWFIDGRREVRRLAIDQHQHLGSSIRRTAEWVRSLLGQQERWLLWRPLAGAPGEREACRLSASTVERWVDQAGKAAAATVKGQSSLRK